MSEMKIPNVAIPVFFLSEKDAIKNDDKDFLMLYKWARPICNALEIKCPLLTWQASITHMNDKTGEITKLSGMSYHKEDISNIPETLVMISMEERNFYYLNATLAHELRHVWQHKQPGYTKRIHAQGIEESAKDPEEIDADAFAIWFISTSDEYTIESAAEFFCSNEKMLFPKYFDARIQRAYEIKAEIDRKFPHGNSKNKKSFIKKLFERRKK